MYTIPSIEYNRPMEASGRHIRWWLVLLIVAMVLIVAGVLQGDFIEVLHRAQLICYECMGLG